MGDSKMREGHASLDLASRALKARKIERLLGLQNVDRPLTILEIGCGAGGISHYFANHETLNCKVHAVDVEDKRQITDGYEFSLVHDVGLPFADAMFDVVFSNHVIEHVGDKQAQQKHLQEISRVMKPDGKGYLAVPNRWQWIEPHYRLAGLSWLPERLRTPYLKFRKSGKQYDCRPLSARQIEGMLDRIGFDYLQIHGRALKFTYEIENPGALIYRIFFKHCPDWVFHFIRRIFPTLIYTLEKRD